MKIKNKVSKMNKKLVLKSPKTISIVGEIEKDE